MKGLSKDVAFLLLAAALILGAVQLLSSGGGGGSVAPTPAVFEEGLTFEDAASRAQEEQRPVMVFATADWCGPCQRLKRGALVDPGVEAFIRENLQPVYLDVDQQQALARKFNVSGIPATLIVRGDRVVASTTGVVPPDAYLAWLRDAVGE